MLKDFPGGDQAPVILVITRSDGGTLSPADLSAYVRERLASYKAPRSWRYSLWVSLSARQRRGEWEV